MSALPQADQNEISWKYFAAAAIDEAAIKLNRENAKVEKLTFNLGELATTLPKYLQLVTLRENIPSGQPIVQFGVEAAPHAPFLGCEWVETKAEGVYQARKGTVFFQNQARIVEQINQCPSTDFTQVLGNGGDEMNDPRHLKTIVKAGRQTLARTADKPSVFANKNRAPEGPGWLFISQINDQGICYRPPGTTAISFKCMNKRFGDPHIENSWQQAKAINTRIEALEGFRVSRPHDALKSYYQALVHIA